MVRNITRVMFVLLSGSFQDTHNVGDYITFLKMLLEVFFILFIFREREREKARERNTDVSVASCTPPTGHPAHNPGMCPDWE